MTSATIRLAVQGLELEAAWSGAPRDDGPTIVMLHEGLGCLGLWRDFPDRLGRRCGRPVLAFSRRGYGGSDPWPRPWPVRYMHDEGLEILPAVLETAGITRHILFGHSDGASIALVYAGGTPARGLEGLVLEAPHVFTEPICVEAIAEVRRSYRHGDLRRRLERYHGANVDDAFYGWADAWLHPDFLTWNLEAYLAQITVPALLIQGEDDEYGTLAQLDRTEAGLGGRSERLVLARCGHGPHVDRCDAVLEAAGRFIETLS